jgi:hypothetical protein
LLREVDRRTGLTAAVSGCLPDPRDPDLIEHEQSAMIAQRILGIASGHENLNDHQTMRHDPALQLAAGVDPLAERPLASPPTLCRLERRVTRAALVKMQGVFVEQFIAAHDEPPEQIILDFDAAADAIHGKQEGRYFHGYYDGYCYLPLYVFSGEHLLCAYLRPSGRGLHHRPGAQSCARTPGPAVDRSRTVPRAAHRREDALLRQLQLRRPNLGPPSEGRRQSRVHARPSGGLRGLPGATHASS